MSDSPADATTSPTSDKRIRALPELTVRQIAAACAAVAFVVSVIGAGIAMWAAGGSTSALVRLPAEEPLGAYVQQRHADWDFVQPATRYDGLYYYAIALDPFATGEQHELIDAPAYRYGHVGHGWLAAIVSLGSEDRLPAALLLLGLAGMVAAAYAGSLLAVQLGASVWLGLLVAVNPGLIYAVTVDTPETTGIAVMAIGLLTWLRGRIWLAAGSFILACLIKEAFVFVPIGIGIFEVVERLRGRKDPDLWFRLGVLSLGPLALASWFVYLHGRLGLWPFAEGPENLAQPIVGWVDTFRLAGLQGQGAEYQVGAIGLPLLIAIGAALLIGIVKGMFLRTPLDPIFVLSVFLIFSLSWLALLYPKDLLRNVSPLLFLLPYLFLARPVRKAATTTPAE